MQVWMTATCCSWSWCRACRGEFRVEGWDNAAAVGSVLGLHVVSNLAKTSSHSFSLQNGSQHTTLLVGGSGCARRIALGTTPPLLIPFQAVNQHFIKSQDFLISL